MAKTITMSNKDIYEIGRKFVEDFQDDISLPVKVGFYLRKNIKHMIDLATEIDNERADILSKYGTLTEDGKMFSMQPDGMAQAQQEVDELLSLSQDVSVYILDLDDFDGVSLTTGQIDAISYMLKETEE